MMTSALASPADSTPAPRHYITDGWTPPGADRPTIDRINRAREERITASVYEMFNPARLADRGNRRRFEALLRRPDADPDALEELRGEGIWQHQVSTVLDHIRMLTHRSKFVGAISWPYGDPREFSPILDCYRACGLVVAVAEPGVSIYGHRSYQLALVTPEFLPLLRRPFNNTLPTRMT